MDKYGVSLIVPVYNVEKYLNNCIDSLLNQSDSHYEIIIINDGSTDGSIEICKRYIDEHPQIKYFEQSNKGLGYARMAGIPLSEYEYISFIDSDDWISPVYVEKMLEESDAGKADIVYCDCAYCESEDRITKIARFRSELDAASADINMRLSFGYPNMWGAIYKKSVWLNNKIVVKNRIYEDTASYGVLLEYFKDIRCCNEALYYYRTGRTGSLMQEGRKSVSVMKNALVSLVEETTERNIFCKNKLGYRAFCIRQIQNEWENVINHRSGSNEEEATEIFTGFLDTYFSDWRNVFDRKYIAIGSYNVCAIYNRIKLFRELRTGKFQFASLVDLTHHNLTNDRFSYRVIKNQYRAEMVKKLIDNEFERELTSESVIILDLLSENTDLIRINDDYFSKSEALLETVDFYGQMCVIPAHSEQRFEVWKEACRGFGELIKTKGCERIYLLKYSYNTQYGDIVSRMDFDNQARIKQDNEMLKRYFEYFISCVPEARVVNLEAGFQYTDKAFPFGCEPTHLNEFAYTLLGSMISEDMSEE